MSQVYVLDTLGNPLAIVEDFERIEWTRDFYTPGKFKMEFNLNTVGATKIQKGTTLIGPQEDSTQGFSPDAVYLVGQIERSIDERGKGNETFVASGRSLSGMFDERLVLPLVGQEYDNRNGPAESIMKYFVTVNAASGAAAARQVPNLFVVTDQGRGAQVNIQGRYQTVAQVLEEMAYQADMGWETFYNTTTKVFNFDVIVGVNRAVGSATPVFFDLSFETIRKLDWLQSDLQLKSFAYLGGKGEGATRPIVQRFLGGSAPTGLARREFWIDGQDLDLTAAQNAKADAELQARQTEEIIEAEITDLGPFRYRVSWDLGDIVTVRNTKWGLLKNVRIVGVTNTLVAGEPRLITTVQLSRPWPTLYDKIHEVDMKNDGQRRV